VSKRVAADPFGNSRLADRHSQRLVHRTGIQMMTPSQAIARIRRNALAADPAAMYYLNGG
jgi:hypothetical protein